ncbi:MAG: hypothetical protein M1839_006258 [Geoglossum umbratile]|nr:MAG: hypothetical protein M1839_006258 [Geoglossum umbratile]
MPPLIEILPNTSTATTAPGWAYVLDTGLNDPSKASPLQPAGPRQRNARNNAAGGQETTARQNNAVLKHLAELERDNHREVQIPVSLGKGREVGRITKTKLTPTVRRILLSQKTFANHLADEEALLSNQTTSAAAAAGPPSTARPARATTATPTTQATTATPTATTKYKKRALAPPKSQKLAQKHHPKPQPPAQSNRPPTPTSTSASTSPASPLPLLLTTTTPTPPSETTIATLLSAPPLPYTAARACPPASGAPARCFCEICGYWGRVRCLKCGARVCGLECKVVHDEGRCLRFYA